LSKTLLSRLAMFEILDAAGPLTVSELAARSGLDAAVVSRTVSACARDGWLTRTAGKISIGPRATLLGSSSPFAEIIARAAPLVHAVAGVTGMAVNACSLVGTSAVIVASASGLNPGIPPGLATKAPLHATAAGLAIAAQLDARQLDSLLPREPYPDAAAVIAETAGTTLGSMLGSAHSTAGLPRGRAELRARLEVIKEDGFATDPGSLYPTIACIAVPWPQAGFPSAIACLGSPGAIDTAAGLIRHVLALAAMPGTTHDRIITGAAAAIEPGSLAGSPVRGYAAASSYAGVGSSNRSLRGCRVRGALSRAARCVGRVASRSARPTAMITTGERLSSSPKASRTASLSKPPIWWADSPCACAWVTREATACPVSYSANGCGLPSSALVRAATRMRALAAPAHSWLPGRRAANSCSCACSSRRATRKRHGWLFPADGAHRAASSSAARSSSPT
jgi:DNA-binding IclR family transcriptional regulator